MSAARQARILLVDDRRENLVALEAIMQGMPVSTVAVTSGEGALKKLLTEEFAVILLDAQMPGMDGFETAQRIKQREATRHTPIIFLTAADKDSHMAFRGYAAGAVDYITKPFDPWALRAKVSIFVDLWSLKEKAKSEVVRMTSVVAERDRLREIAVEAMRLLREGNSDHPPEHVAKALAVLARAAE
ncbi:response regulator receiver domain-containing protein [Stackebrandtia endophytica]|uniref:Response regulator receiver domain-containing protein n=1 Tax=Stackebrandtia endophytica TaxID=1496996 RepID=A0A543AY93_9ACTN|nr:response regulator [Stackebrandtia endophytica]TQL77552.1 response regulator receiver domain-containing protein [Stackebrandtia endophytica]